MRKKGITLVEVLVASLVLAVLAAAAFSIFFSGKVMLEKAKLLVIGSDVGKDISNVLHMDVNRDLWSSNCLGANINCPGSISVDGTTYTPQYAITTVDGTLLRKVKLKVNWNGP